ncbi:hypothetical protein OBBRIDRAFT_789735 [Obba rivulosa]|uniref:MYND-type domain-containing protein n=1 Tax=Obba rivulosa TaxID=1052685 RepID=A0A8E2DQM4_9APHY|nr:hypothetical protein OBBRIDRAFT_789735 [Obba rivulosa]
MCSAFSGFSFESKGKKLLMCSACKDAWYCNRECQLADRKEHKLPCSLRQLHLKVVEADDVEHALVAPQASLPRDTIKKPLLTDFAEEFHAFASRFRLDFMEAFVLARASELQASPEVPKVLYVRVVRVKNPATSSKPWSRFDIRSADLYTFPELQKAMPRALQNVTPLAALKASEDIRQEEIRALGHNKRMAMVIVSASSASRFSGHGTTEPFGKVMTQPYVLSEPDDVETIMNWRERLIATVRKKCGRAYIEEAGERDRRSAS